MASDWWMQFLNLEFDWSRVNSQMPLEEQADSGRYFFIVSARFLEITRYKYFV